MTEPTQASALIPTNVSSLLSVNAEVHTYPRALLAYARTLIDNGPPSIAVVVAHMACEIATERRLSDAFIAKGIEDLESAVTAFLSGYSFGSDRFRDLYITLTGDNIKNEAFWSEFKKSTTRRNNIIHRGLIVSIAEAEASHKAANDFLTHLKF